MISALKTRQYLSGFLLLLAGASFFVGRCTAQNADEAVRIAASLAPESRAVIERLSSLHELQDGVWKMHSGDIAHGEDANLDESSWQSFATPGEGSLRTRCPCDR